MYRAEKHIYVSLDHSRIVDPKDDNGEGSMLLIAAGQSVDDETAKALGLKGGGDPDSEAMRHRMWGSHNAYTESGSLVAASSGLVPMGPGGVPASAATGAAPMGTPPGGAFAEDDEVEDVMRRSGVSRHTAEGLMKADQESYAGHLAQHAVHAAIRAQRAQLPRTSTIMGEEVDNKPRADAGERKKEAAEAMKEADAAAKKLEK